MAPDLKDLLRDAAAQPARPLDLDDVRRRAGGVARGRRLRAGLAGVAVLAALGLLAVPVLNLLDTTDVEFADTPPGEQDPIGPEDGGPPEEWESLPPAPIVPRTEAASVWTGTEMLVWGGTDPARDYEGLSDGAAYNPSTSQWRTIAPSPLTTTGETTGVWTGSELLVWSGNYQGGDGGAAYDPATDRWRLLPSAPIQANNEATAVWTGDEMIVWGGHDPRRASGDGAAYDPRANTWRRLPAAPIAPRFYHEAVWTGEEMVVWGGTAGDGAGVTRYADGAAYNPASDTWRTIAAAPLSARDPGGVVWTGKDMLVIGGYAGDDGVPARDGAAYDPAKDAWRSLPEIGLNDITRFAWAGDQVVAWGAEASSALTLTPAGRGGLVLPGNHGRLGDDAVAAWTGEQLIIWGGVDGNGNPVDDGAVLNTAAYPSPGSIRRLVPPPPNAGNDVGPNQPPPIVRGGGSLESGPGGPPGGADNVLELWPLGGNHVDQALTNGEDAATAFGRRVLGWRDARVTDGEPTEDGTFGERLTLASDEVRRSVVVMVVPDRESDGRWVVASVGVTDIGDTTLGVAIRGKRVQVNFDGWNGPPRLASAELLVDYPDQGVQATAGTEPLNFDVDLSHTPTNAGSVLLLFRDDQGQVIGAMGTGVPAGDFTAG